MIYPSPDKLDRSASKYALVIVAAKRARQLKDGARKLVESTSANPLTVALEELAEGAVIPLQVGGPERLPDTVAQGPVLQGLVSSTALVDLDDDSAAVKAALLGVDDAEAVLGDELDMSDEDEDEDLHDADEVGEVPPSAGLIDLAGHDTDDDADADEDDDVIAHDDDNEVSLEEMADAEQSEETDDIEE